MERYFDYLVFVSTSRHDFIYLLLYWSCCIAGRIVPWISRHGFVLKEFIRCFYIAGEFTVVDNMYVYWNFFTADKYILCIVYVYLSLSICCYIPPARQIILELHSVCDCGLWHMWSYRLSLLCIPFWSKASCMWFCTGIFSIIVHRFVFTDWQSHFYTFVIKGQV